MPGFPSLAGVFRQRPGREVPVSTGSAPPDHFFENAQHGLVVRQCIGDGVLPLRFAYAGSAAYTHDRLAGSEGYRSVIGSVELEVRALLNDASAVAALSRVVEIGPGNGVHTVALLRSLTDRGMPCRDYLGLDFSATLLTLASDRIREASGVSVCLTSGVWDIESTRSAQIERWRAGLEDDGPVVVCLLGHTLGNVESGIEALQHVHGSMRAGDILVAGVSLLAPAVDHAAMLAPYRTEVFRRAALEPLHAAGVDPADVHFDVHFTDGVVVGQAVFVRSVQMGELSIPSGHVLRCFCSRRFAMKDVLSLLARTGWKVRSAVVDDPREHAVVLAVRGMP